MNKNSLSFMRALFFVLLFAHAVAAQSTSFSYQGRLESGGNPANGNHDFEFALFDAPAGGMQLGLTVSLNNVIVTNGIFSVQLDFGNQYPGASRFLEIRVRPAGQPGITILAPRQSVASSPYSVKSISSDTAVNAQSLGGLAANQFVLTGDSRLSDPRTPAPGSANYIQNSATPQAASSFNISGNGTAGGNLTGSTVTATTQFNIGANRVVMTPGNSLFVGVNAGNSGPNPGGGNNTFVGNGAGGSHSNQSMRNAVFGTEAGNGLDNGSNNSYFGYRTGAVNTGSNNTFFGFRAGGDSTTGHENVFIGSISGAGTTTGNLNTFLGTFAGGSNTTGRRNTLVGNESDVLTGNLEFATAIGAGAVVGLSNTVLLGRIDGSDRVQIPGQLQLVSLATGGSVSLCRNASSFISTCSSSLRYKSNVETFSDGLLVIRRLRPISFNWLEGEKPDLGFGAEEVNEVEPRLVERNAKGEIEGVKYGQVTTVLVNAVKEQQAQIEELRRQVEGLRALICMQNPAANLCDTEILPGDQRRN